MCVNICFVMESYTDAQRIEIVKIHYSTEMVRLLRLRRRFENVVDNSAVNAWSDSIVRSIG